MGMRHAEQEQIERLEAKTLDAQLRQILVAGLACSPFEAEAVLEAVQEVYAPFFHGPDAAADDSLLQQLGPRDFRRQRIPELCQQALSQGALLTREDLACRIFLVGLRTISRDLAWLRAHDERPLPLRGMVHDIGPLLTHLVEVIRLALQGKTSTEICQILRHSPEAVANYLGTFTRCAKLHRKGMEAP